MSKTQKVKFTDKDISLSDLFDIIQRTKLGWSKRWINRLVAEKSYPKSEAHGKYPVIAFLLRIINEIIDDLEIANTGNGKKTDHESEVAMYKAFNARADWLEREGKLIPIELHIERMETFATTVLSILDRMDRKLPPLIVGKSLSEAKKLTTEFKNELRAELSNTANYSGLELGGKFKGNNES